MRDRSGHSARTPETVSLEQKLPLLMTALLAAILLASLILTHRTLTVSAETSARERLDRAAIQLAATVEQASRIRAAAVKRMARDSNVRRLIPAPLAVAPAGRPAADSAARAALDRLVGPADSALALELWNADGERIAWRGPDLPASERTQAPAAGFLTRKIEGVENLAVIDSVAVGPMYPVGRSIYFWVVAPVVRERQVVGYVAQQRKVGGPQEATRSLRDLIGEDVDLYLHNADGSVWSSAPGFPAGPPQPIPYAAADMRYRESLGQLLVVEKPAIGTPWVVALEAPLRSIHARARTTLATLILVSLALIALGAVAAWAISRRITRPLVSLTHAAENIAHGDFGSRVAVESDDEVGRLAISFNQMATEIAASHAELERRVVDAHAARMALEAANVDLQNAIAAADQARQEAERANRAKSDFLAVMSHELRTPLNAIGGYTQLIEDAVYGPVTEEQRRALTRIARSQAHLLRLITDVLNFARIDAGQIEYEIEDVPVAEMLERLEPMLAPQVDSKRLTYVCADDVEGLVVRADPEKLFQVLLNLLTNAIKFTPEGGRIKVDAIDEGERIRVCIRDSGPGISADRVPHIFEPFVQVDRALNRPNEGVGLGLSISRDLARGMGGDLEVRSVVGEGSEFSVLLPNAAAAPAGRAPKRGASEKESAGRT